MSAETRIDFYVLQATEPSARLRFACRLTEKAYGLENRVHAHATSAAQASELDEMLWTFRGGSFVPHELTIAGQVVHAPVTIGHGATYTEGDLLINLADKIPAFFDHFPRLAEIVDGSPDGRRLGRERFSFYRDNGYSPQTHRIG